MLWMKEASPLRPPRLYERLVAGVSENGRLSPSNRDVTFTRVQPAEAVFSGFSEATIGFSELAFTARSMSSPSSEWMTFGSMRRRRLPFTAFSQ